MSKIWASNSNEEAFNQRLHEICFKTNLDYDNLLMPYDIEALIAHGEMLGECNLISSKDSKIIVSTLKNMLDDAKKGDLKMTPDVEDCHSLIEAELIKRAGDAENAFTWQEAATIKLSLPLTLRPESRDYFVAMQRINERLIRAESKIRNGSYARLHPYPKSYASLCWYVDIIFLRNHS